MNLQARKPIRRGQSPEISPQSVQRLSPAKLSNLGEFDISSSRFVPRACAHKSAPCKRGSVNVRFAPKATELLPCRKTSPCANFGLLGRTKTVCEGPSPEKPMHKRPRQAWKVLRRWWISINRQPAAKDR